MAEMKDLGLALRAWLTAYRWRRIDPVPSTRRRRPLSECRVGLVSSAGFVAAGQEPFDCDRRGGDWSWRAIPSDTDPRTLVEHHRSEAFDHAGLEEDANLGLPLEPLLELAAEGAIGSVASHHVSLMGSITAPGRLVKFSVPEIVELFVRDEVDVALMVPV